MLPNGEIKNTEDQNVVRKCVEDNFATLKSTTPNGWQLFASADCKKSILRSHTEKLFKVVSARAISSKSIEIIWQHVRTSQMLDGSCASGAPPLTEQFTLLCPARLREIAGNVDEASSPSSNPINNSQSYPSQLLGAWGGRAAFQGDDNPKVAAQACTSYRKNPRSVQGDLLVFKGSQKLSYGGYTDYIDKNVSVKQIGSEQWEIKDRHYHDGEGGGKAGYKIITYKVSVSGQMLTITEGKITSRYSRCP